MSGIKIFKKTKTKKNAEKKKLSLNQNDIKTLLENKDENDKSPHVVICKKIITHRHSAVKKPIRKSLLPINQKTKTDNSFGFLSV